MSFHPEILTSNQDKVLRQLAPVLGPRDCYLAGGIALGLHLGHRRSADLDWFTEREFGDPQQLADVFCRSGIPFKPSQLDEGVFFGSVSRVRISLMLYPYPRLGSLVPNAPAALPLLSLEDLAAMKMAAVANRGRRRDFVDVYALGQHHFTLRQMVELFRRKYCIQDIDHLRRSLTYFNDAAGDVMPKMFWKVDWRTIKKTIRQWAEELPA